MNNKKNVNFILNNKIEKQLKEEEKENQILRKIFTYTFDKENEKLIFWVQNNDDIKNYSSLRLKNVNQQLFQDCEFNPNWKWELCFSNFPNLKQFSCWNSNFSIIRILECKNLEIINCSNNNQLKSIEISKCLNLKELDCSQNELENLIIEDSNTLIELDCSSNQLRNLKHNNFLNLKYLMAGDNLLEKISINCPNLEYLDLRENKLERISLWEDNKLQYINVSGNLLSFFNYQALNPKTLTDFEICDNWIEETNIKVFSHLVNLETLLIGTNFDSKNDNRENGIYNLYHGSFKSLKNLNKLTYLNVMYTNINAGVEFLPISLKGNNAKFFYLSIIPSMKKIDLEILKEEESQGKVLIRSIINELDAFINNYEALMWNKINKYLNKRNRIKKQTFLVIRLQKYLQSINPNEKEFFYHIENSRGVHKGENAFVREFKIPSAMPKDKVWNVQKAIWSLLRYNHKDRNIVRNLGSFSDEWGINGSVPRSLSLVSEFVEGQVLTNLITATKSSEIESITIPQIHLMIGIVRGLTYLQNAQIPHYSLRSLNVFYTLNCEVKIANFGITPIINQLTSENWTNSPLQNHEVYNNAFWLDPRFLNKLLKKDKNIEYLLEYDIYSLGMVLWEICSKETKPYNKINNEQILELIVNDDLREVIPDYVPFEIVNIIKSCWKITPASLPNYEKIDYRNLINKRMNLTEIEESLMKLEEKMRLVNKRNFVEISEEGFDYENKSRRIEEEVNDLMIIESHE